MSATAAPYNTALVGQSDLDALRRGLGQTRAAASAHGVVFTHAVGTPYRAGERAIIARAACIYSEIPWPAGWAVYHARVGLTPLGTYAAYIAAIKATIIDAFGKPTFIVCDKRSAGKLSQRPPRPIRLDRLKGAERTPPVWLAVSNADAPEATSTTELLAALARRYPSVYDFGCGYGNALRPFGYFVGSDIDQKCLDYIAQELL